MKYWDDAGYEHDLDEIPFDTGQLPDPFTFDIPTPHSLKHWSIAELLEAYEDAIDLPFVDTIAEELEERGHPDFV